MDTVAERAAVGKAARVSLPRTAHREFKPGTDRRDPVELLAEQGASRVPEILPLRYACMLASPLAYYRGAAYPMAADLAGMPNTGLDVQLCGDAHLMNFGVFAAPDRSLVFSMNDFDETLPGPFEWDLKRLVASFAIAGRERGFDPEQRAAINESVVKAYRDAMRQFASMGAMDVWYARLDADEVTADSGAGADGLGELTEVTAAGPRIVGDPPLIVPVDDLAESPEQAHHGVRTILRAYIRSLPADRRMLLDRYRYAHAARTVVGAGSVGTRAWITLLVGRDSGDPLLLQVTEARASVLEPFLGASRHGNHGRRVVEGQRLMQATCDVLLGWVRATDLEGVKRDFYVRQLWDDRGSPRVERMKPSKLAVYAQVCGRTLARAHARSGDPIAIASYVGSSAVFDRALAGFAEDYADQNERDHDALRRAEAAGRVSAG